MPNSFYVMKPGMLRDALSEHATLKDAEKDLKAGTVPGEYIIVQVVREATINPVPETTRVVMNATRTRPRTSKSK